VGDHSLDLADVDAALDSEGVLGRSARLGAGGSPELGAARVLALQRSAGNRAVARLLGRSETRHPRVLLRQTAAERANRTAGRPGVGALAGYDPGEREASRTSPGGVESTEDGFLLFNFAVNGDVIKAEHEAALRKFVRDSKLDSKESLFPIKEIIGFGDAVHRQGGNAELREDRAESVQSFLSQIGTIDANLGVARAAASDRFITTNETAVGRARNRAVLITTEAFLPPEPKQGLVRFRLLVKVIANPRIEVAAQVKNVGRAYGPHLIGVELFQQQVVPPDEGSRFNVVSVGHCSVSEDIAPDLKELHDTLRGNVRDDVIVMFIVHDILKDTDSGDSVKINGCARHPADKPGGVVAHDAGPWSLAHEIGHILGVVEHSDDPNALMHIPTTTDEDKPPTLSDDELDRIRRSRLVHFR
jgi:outer membrane protein OmpA-like peptidoglycan-associated protein